MAAKSDYYDILGISKGTPAGEIKKAYRKEALKWHPDKHKDNKEAAERRFKEINEAYQILSDTEKRRAYDQYGHAAFAPGGRSPSGQSPFGRAGQQGPFTYTYTTSGGGANPFAGYDFGDPFEIFAQFFGGGAPFAGARQIPRYSVTLEFMEAIKGVEKEIEFGGEKRKIKIPAGVGEGSRIRFGDFILSVNVKPHDVFERDGADILIKVAIPYSLAILGGRVEVPTIDGDLKIRVRPGTASGTMFRLRGKGAPYLRRRGKGDEYVRLVVDIPGKLTCEQKRLVKELQNQSL